MLQLQTYPVLHQNKPSRESIFCGKVGGWCTERALIMLIFLQKTRQNYLYCIHAHEQLDGKHVRLRPPARAVAEHAVHGQRRRHHGNEKQSATDSRFSTCRDSIECFPPGRSLRHKHLVLTTLPLTTLLLTTLLLTTYYLQISRLKYCTTTFILLFLHP